MLPAAGLVTKMPVVHPPDEDEFIEDGRKETDDRFEKRSVRISHVAASGAVR